MAAKYYAGSPISGKEMDGLTFVFEAIEVTGGSWRGVFKTEIDGEISALSKLAADGQVKEITEETYNAFMKKKAVRQATSPHLNAASEQQAVGHVAAPAPKESVDDVLEVQQVAPLKRKGRPPKKI